MGCRGLPAVPAPVGAEAARLKRAFNQAFWLPAQGWYAAALDRDKRPVDALTSSIGYRRFIKTLPAQDVSSGYLIGLGAIMNLLIGAVGIALAGYLVVSGLQAA